MKKYRVKIQEIIENSHSHLTAEEVFRLLRETFPQVVRATVYNNLNALCEAGLVRKVSVQGMPDRYDRIRRHDHLVCKACGRLVDLDLSDLTHELQRQVSVPFLSYDLKLVYLCEQCQKKRNEGDGIESSPPVGPRSH